MSKSIVRAALVVALAGAVLGLTQTVQAQAEKKADKAKSQQATGEITAVDVKANTVTIKHKTASMTFNVASDAKFGSGGENIALNLTNLKIGDKVTVHYTDDAGKLTAHKIGHVDISAKKAAKDEKKAAQ